MKKAEGVFLASTVALGQFWELEAGGYVEIVSKPERAGGAVGWWFWALPMRWDEEIGSMVVVGERQKMTAIELREPVGSVPVVRLPKGVA